MQLVFIFMEFKKPKVICYDWDNTLVNTLPVTLISMNLLYKKYGIPELVVDDVYKINGYSFEQVFVATFGKEQARKIQDEYQLIYNQYSQNMLQPLEGAKETIRFFHNEGIKQCVLSNKPGTIVREEAERFGFAKYFELIAGPDDTGAAKPDRAMFDIVEKNIEFKDKWHHPSKLWFFGDASVDAEFAKNINAHLFFFGDISLINNFPTDQLTMLKSRHEIKHFTFEEETK